MDKKKAALLSIFSNSALIIMKLAAGLIIGSVSIISEAIHSGIDLLASFIAYFSIIEASKLPDEEHPFGHGKVESVSAFTEALLILLAGVLIVIEAVKKIFSPHEIKDVGIGIIVMLIGSVVNLIISRALLRIAKKQKSLALEADAMHLLTDVYTSAGVMGGLILIRLTGLVILDSIAALAVAVLIIYTSIGLIRKSLQDLIDTRVSDEDIKKLETIIYSFREIKTYHKMRTRKAGHSLELDVHIKMDKKMSLEEAHRLCNELEANIKKEFPSAYVVLHPEPYFDVPK